MDGQNEVLHFDIHELKGELLDQQTKIKDRERETQHLQEDLIRNE
jgi:chromosome segregation ATPase